MCTWMKSACSAAGMLLVNSLNELTQDRGLEDPPNAVSILHLGPFRIFP